MKRLLFERSYQPFLLTALIVFSIAIFIRGTYPASEFDVSIYNNDINLPTSGIWFAFSAYLFFLAVVYYIIFRSKLRNKKWLVISHYVFILLFLVFFALFSAFGNESVQSMVAGVPILTLISIYAIIFMADMIFFVVGVLLLLVNIFTLNRSKP